MVLSSIILRKAIYRLFISCSLGRGSVIAFFTGIIIMIAFLNLFSLTAQNLPPEAVAAEVYQSLKEFPLENQYISSQTGEPAPDNTLISRIIRYHQYVKSRPVEYRLDWKLTLADYLGVNETIEASRYPGNTTLKNSPLESDRAIISNLNRIQRNELIDTLVSIYSSQSESSSNTEPSPSQPTVDNTRDRQTVPQRGSADLLLP